MLARWVVVFLLIGACSGSQPTGSVATPSIHTPGPLGDTWTRDGGTWTKHGGGPSPRYLAAIAYDLARHEYVLFGGQTATGTSGETWTFDGTRWTQQRPAHNPPPRRGAAMAFDTIHQVVVLYGGLIPDQSEGNDADDTWTWNGNDWTHVGPADGAPGPRDGASMVSTAGGVLLFGGRNSNVTYYGDVWRFGGSTWTRIATNRPTGPAGRAGAAVAWDPAHNALLVFGGVGMNIEGGPGAQGVPLADTWLLTGSGWDAQIPTGPPSEAFTGAFWDATAQRVTVMLGIACPQPIATAWQWDGTGWSQAADAGVSPRWGAAVATDGSGQVLVFGGDDQAGC